jgi:16S rRNA (guanine966-N2)-methyltransferase
LGTLRIIGGIWRGKKFTFPEIPGLRPTPNRVRETLFNWLTPVIHDAHCLDLFTGSGALGLEALSRGAGHVVMVDQSLAVIHHLKELKKSLSIEQLSLYHAKIPSLDLPLRKFHIVFLDPPFYQGLIATCTTWLDESDCLAPHALIYMETEKELTPLPLPTHWHIIKAKKAGQVRYYLVESDGKHK